MYVYAHEKYRHILKYSVYTIFVAYMVLLLVFLKFANSQDVLLQNGRVKVR